ncbi:hypothetical protein TNCV_4603441 [Trichonephila clavipes]|nr:hypothetical protein TNCV_4603441 [Trichonephila clavipes]
MGLYERKSVVLDGFEWICRKKVSMHMDVCRTIRKNSRSAVILYPPLEKDQHMGKLSDLDPFDSGQIVGAQRKSYSISEIVRQPGLPRSTVSRVN